MRVKVTQYWQFLTPPFHLTFPTFAVCSKQTQVCKRKGLWVCVFGWDGRVHVHCAVSYELWPGDLTYITIWRVPIVISSYHTSMRRSFGPQQCSRYSDLLWARHCGNWISVVSRFSYPVRTDPGARPASYTVFIKSLYRGEVARAWWAPTPSRAEGEKAELYLSSPFGL
jgi:hypothetical protein